MQRGNGGEAVTGGRPTAARWPEVAFRFLFLLTVAAFAAFQRDLARLSLRVGGVPLFVGEATIVVLVVLLVTIAFRRREWPFPRDLFPWLVIAYLAIGGIYTVHGLLLGFGLAALRDAALAYYAVFALLALAFRHFGSALEALAIALAAGAAVGSAVWTVLFLLHPSLLDGHGVPSYAGIVAWLGVLGAVLLPGRGRWWQMAIRHGGLVACSFVALLSAYRTMLAVLLMTAAVLGGLGVLRVSGLGFRPLVRLAAWTTVMLATIAALRCWLPPPPSPTAINGPRPLPQALSVVAQRWLPGGVAQEARFSTVRTSKGGVVGRPLKNPGSLEGSIAFRKQTWRNAVVRICRHPVAGIGFGPPAALFPDVHCQIASSPLSNCGNAHNTYLTVAMRFGLPVFVLFVALNIVAAARGFRAVALSLAKEGAAPLVFLGTAYVGLGVYGAMSLLLESPYLALIYWTVLGGLAGAPVLPELPGGPALRPEPFSERKRP